MTERRRRGVRGSPIKLQQALDASGLKTQTAVAERIADNEGLNNPPRSLVNKVFQGAQVDARSVQRIATALGVDAWSLYASRDDPAAAVPDANEAESEQSIRSPTTAPDPKRSLTRSHMVAVSLTLIAVALLAWNFWLTPATDQALHSAADTSTTGRPQQTAHAGPVTALIVSDVASVSPSTLGNMLPDNWRILPGNTAAALEPQDALDRNAADVVVIMRSIERGRWQSLSILTHWPDGAFHSWQAILPIKASAQRIAHHLRQAASAIAQQQPINSASREAQRKTLVGKHHLDLERTESNVRRALTEFESAIRSDPNYAPAYAGLCDALVTENIRTGQQSRLNEAAPQCKLALDLAPDDLDARRTQALLHRRLGRPEEATDGFLQVLQTDPDDVQALLGISEAYLARYQLGQGDRFYEQAETSASRAQQIEPEFWKTSYLLGRVFYFGGRIDRAVAATQQAATIHPNMNTLSNLGTFQFCAADFDAAASSYEQIRRLVPNSYVPEQQLAAVHYHRRNYESAAAGFRRALDLHEASGAAEDFRIWGNYADSLRMTGSPGATAAYQRAIMLNERLLAEGDARPSHAIAKAYYLEMMNQLDPTVAPLSAQALDQLTSKSNTADPRFVMLLAVVHAYRGQLEQARALSQKASSGCPGMLASPDLERAGLAPQDSV